MGIMDMEDFPSTTKTDGMVSISIFTFDSVLIVYYDLSFFGCCDDICYPS
jgi:hypothetical protein